VVAILAGIPDGNIREVIAFPKTSGGSDLLTGAPTPIEESRWSELALQVVAQDEPQG
jgi:aspartyl-tRNA synthetase